MPECFFGHHVLLSAVLAKLSLYDSAAVQAILIFSLGYMGQNKIFLKINTKKYKAAFLFRYTSIQVTLTRETIS